MQVIYGMLLIILGQFILMRSYGIRKLMLILHGLVNGLMIGALLAMLVLVGMGALSQANSASLLIGILLAVGGAIAVVYLACKFERLYIIITSAISLFGMIASLAVLALMTLAVGGSQGGAGLVIALLILVVAVVVTIKLFKYIVKYYPLAFMLQTCLIGASLVTIGVVALGTLVWTRGRLWAAVPLAQFLLTATGALYQWNRYRPSIQ